MATDTTSEAPAVPAANGKAAPERSDEELARELLELEQKFPPPQRGAEIPDARWFEENYQSLLQQHKGLHVAILNRAVIGSGVNELQLRIDLARKYQVHPYGFLVVDLFPLWDFAPCPESS